MPDSQMRDETEIAKVTAAADCKKYEELVEHVRGLAVQYPLDFMQSEDLRKPKYFSLGVYVVPETLFT